MQDLHSIHTHRLRRYHNPLNPKNPLNRLNPHAEGVSAKGACHNPRPRQPSPLNPQNPHAEGVSMTLTVKDRLILKTFLINIQKRSITNVPIQKIYPIPDGSHDDGRRFHCLRCFAFR